jgi:ATP-binding cassette subfamily B multidrug efflux pump
MNFSGGKHMFKLFKYLKKQERLFIIICLVLIICQVWLDLRMPDYMAAITQLVQQSDSEIADILINGGKMLLCAVGSMATAMLVGFFAAKVAAGLAMRLREMVFKKALSFSMEEINGFSTASLITRSTNDVTQIQMIIALGLQAMVKAPILAVWAILKILNKSWQWTMATGVAVVILLIIFTILLIFAVPKFKIIQKLTDNLNRVTRENLTGLRVVRAYNAESYQEEKFEVANNELTQTNLFANRMLALAFPCLTFILSGITLAIYWIGAYLIETAEMAEKLPLFSDMVVFSSYAMLVIMAFMLLAMIIIMLPRATVSAKRILEVLNTKTHMMDGSRTDGHPGMEGEIEFRDVSFAYPGAGGNVLHHISFTAHKGETIAIIGATGSGKTTLVNLIPRFYDATDGTVLVDGINVKEYAQNALHNKIGYVSQRAVLFSGTVSTNVAFGDNGQAPPDSNIIEKAIAIAQGTEFVEKMYNTYDATIAQGGTNVSGGQKQRLSIARAIARKPEIYIFDDSFSALDYKTDRILRSALKRETDGATTLIVAQRIGTIKDADQIIVLEDGEIAGKGTHEELMSSCKTYQEIAYSQLSREELA